MSELARRPMDRFAELDGRRLTIEVPATSANLGAGYDCLALALELHDVIDVEAVARPGGGVIELTIQGDGVDELPADGTNRFVVALELALRAATDREPRGIGWRVAMRNRIPVARGLGSSAAATVGGLIAGNALAGGPLGAADLLALATELEGHPDNAAAALLGGFVVVDGFGGSPIRRPEAIRFDAPRDLRAVLFVPVLQLETRAMRAALPAAVPLSDAIANLGRVAIGVAGLAVGRSDLLAALTQDRLHEPYRATVYPQLPRLVAVAREAGAIGACLSGAGSTIIAFSDSVAVMTRIEAAFLAAAADEGLPGTVRIVAPQNGGARIIAGG